MLRRDQTQTFKHYSAYYKNSFNGHGGVCILVKNNFIHSQVQFQADLQAVAVCITINNKTYTMASIYVGFNGHCYLWGANLENECGKVVEHLIDSHNLIF